MSYDSDTNFGLKPPVTDAALTERTRNFALANIADGPALSRAELGAFLLDVIELGDRLDWQSIDSAPRDGRTIIGWHESWYQPSTIRWNTETDRWRSFPNASGDIEMASWPSHWTPLPQPPVR